MRSQKQNKKKKRGKKQKQSPKTGHTTDLIFFLKNGVSGVKIWNKNNKQKRQEECFRALKHSKGVWL